MDNRGKIFLPPRLDSAPSNPSEAQMYYDRIDKTVYVWDGTDWQDLRQLTVPTDKIEFTPAAAGGIPNNTLFVDSADDLLKFRDSSGTLKTVTLT